VNALDIRHMRTTGYHPQTNGLTERFNGTLVKALAKCAYTTGDDWDNYIPTILFAYQIRKNTTTGKSPFFLLYGMEPKIPMLMGTTLENVIPRESQLQEVGIKRDKLRRDPQQKKSRFTKGDTVLIKKVQKDGKLGPKYDGPLSVISAGPKDTYKLRDERGHEFQTLISGDRLRHYHKAPGGAKTNNTSSDEDN
jgi:hypothetical protein